MRTILLLLLTPVVAFSQTLPTSRSHEQYGKLPISFEANAGQMPAPVKFAARGRGYALMLRPDGAVLALASANELVHVRMTLVGANTGPAITGEHELPGKVNYLIGNDRSRWRTGVSAFRKVRYSGVYAGIDLVYYGNQQQLEYDFVVEPGADPAAIGMKFEGAHSMRVDANGDLVLDAGAEIRMRKPLAYQEHNDRRREIPSRYILLENEQVGFEVKGYDPAQRLVIDPVLEYSTFIGGMGLESAYKVAVDAEGSAYVVGSTTSLDFPTVNAFQPQKPDDGGFFSNDVFVSKLSADGSALVYSTYLGGSSPDFRRGRDFGLGIAVGPSGNAFIVGETSSDNFPVRNALQPTNRGDDAFIAQLNATGSDLVYSTYLGGAGGDAARGVALDAGGSVHIVGVTNSTDFPTVNAFQPSRNDVERDAFVAVLNAEGSALVYSTYFGGGDVEDPEAIAVDIVGNTYITGSTESENFPTLDALQPGFGGIGDAFVAKFTPAGVLAYSTFLGGNSWDNASGIAVDAYGSAYVSGSTQSPDFPLVNPLKAVLEAPRYDAFVSKLNPSGTALSYSTYLGGSDNDSSSAIAVDAAGSAYVTGSTYSADFPTMSAFQPAIGNVTGTIFYDAFVSKLTIDGSGLVYSSYLGSSERDEATGIAVDASGAYVVGSTFSSYFPTRNAMQPEMNGPIDGFVTKIAELPIPGITGIGPSFGSPGTVVGVTIGGVNFVPGATTVSASGAGVSITNVTVTSSTSLTATFTVSDSATLDARNIRVATPNGVSNQIMFMIASASPQCPVSLPVDLKGTVGQLSVRFGIGTTQRVQGNWILTLVTHDGTTPRFYGTALYIAELPAINPPITNWTSLPAEIEGNPVVGVINGYFSPDLCASNAAVASEPPPP